MKTKTITSSLVLFFCLLTGLQAQIDSVIVEKYYVSDNRDATDTIGGGLPAGSTTFRIFVDMAEGSRLLKVFGNADHPFSISSSDFFFNNRDRGRSLGKEIRANRLVENTLALDSWLTIGMATDTHYGILKPEDNDGSIVGGENNDGGSASVEGGLLVNNDLSAGISLTSRDGLNAAGVLPSNWQAQVSGMNINSTTDTTIFGSIKKGNKFVSRDFILSNSGLPGTGPYNRVLIGQLTTSGNLRFELNLVIEEKNGSGTRLVTYVAANPGNDERTNRFLTYPPLPPPLPECGCGDSSYLEYRNDLECHVPDSCRTPVILGCMDPGACNYDPAANLNVQSICCYPGRCNDRDIEVVCPGLLTKNPGVSLYPNPAGDYLTIKITNAGNAPIRCDVFDSYGSTSYSEILGGSDDITQLMNVSCLSRGLYLMRLSFGNYNVVRQFIKN